MKRELLYTIHSLLERLPFMKDKEKEDVVEESEDEFDGLDDGDVFDEKDEV